ncbi:MAG: PQQ-dependent sugar dehydrogenase [Pseudomonadota bacterium]
MRYLTTGILSLAFFAGVGVSAAFSETIETSVGPVEVTPVVGDLNAPWAVAIIETGKYLITERDGRIWFVQDGDKTAVSGVPDVYAEGQGGLLDLVLARDFATTNEVFITYSRPSGRGAGTALAVAEFDEGAKRLRNVRDIFVSNDVSGGGRHFGSRVVEANDGTLFLTIGDRGDRPTAQDPSVHNGSVIRVNRDGSIPSNNPSIDGWAAGIYSIGHRNAQGAALDENGQFWTVSHGARGGDEINKPEPGKNYGWPVISYGTHYSGRKIGVGTAADGLEQPIFFWDPSMAPSGMMIYSGDMFPEWKGDIFVGSLKFSYISRLDRNGTRINGEEELFRDVFARIRDVREGPDGAIYFLAVGEDTLYRITRPQG